MLSAVMYLCVASGLPLPMPAVEKDLSQPFPCMNSQCGCKNAHDCWTNCCCHTPTQRLAWAREHRVNLPKEIVIQLGAELQAKSPATCTAKKTCCLSKSGSKQKEEQCCCKCHHEPVATAPQVEADSIGGLILVRALECRGIGSDWLACGIAVTPRVTQIDFRVEVSAILQQPLSLLESLTFPPPIPPPRSATV